MSALPAIHPPLSCGPFTIPLNHARAAAVVVPARLFDRSLAHRLREAAWNGASVLIELGLAFVDEPHARAQRRLISEEFDLTLGDVVRLWDDGRSRVPYVRYVWPLDVWVRDFSYVVAVSGAGWRVIAQVETVPVAVRRRLGRGSLTILGSPLGPALRAGDPEAAVWFRRFLHGDGCWSCLDWMTVISAARHSRYTFIARASGNIINRNDGARWRVCAHGPAAGHHTGLAET